MTHRIKNDAYNLRLPDGWREAIKEEAAKQRRTMSAEVCVAIETAFRVKGIALPEAPAEK